TSSGSSNSGHPITPQYTFNGTMPTAFAYGTPAGWIPAPQQVQSLPTNMSPQMNAAYNIMFDPSQQIQQQQQAAYLHRSQYE
ncbi:unnamed protein product, partial [Rotaria magnacalcarata]